MKQLLVIPFAILSIFGAPATYVLAVVSTWQGSAPVFLKLLVSITLDALLASIWPITWAFWIVGHLMGSSTPIRTVLGF